MIAYDHQAALQGGDGWHAWREDGTAALTETALNIGTMFLPGGAIAAGGKGAGTAGRAGVVAARFASNTADFLLPGGSWLFRSGSNAVQHSIRIAKDFAATVPTHKTPTNTVITITHEPPAPSRTPVTDHHFRTPQPHHQTGSTPEQPHATRPEHARPGHEGTRHEHIAESAKTPARTTPAHPAAAGHAAAESAAGHAPLPAPPHTSHPASTPALPRSEHAPDQQLGAQQHETAHPGGHQTGTRQTGARSADDAAGHRAPAGTTHPGTRDAQQPDPQQPAVRQLGEQLPPGARSPHAQGSGSEVPARPLRVETRSGGQQPAPADAPAARPAHPDTTGTDARAVRPDAAGTVAPDEHTSRRPTRGDEVPGEQQLSTRTQADGAVETPMHAAATTATAHTGHSSPSPHRNAAVPRVERTHASGPARPVNEPGRGAHTSDSAARSQQPETDAPPASPRTRARSGSYHRHALAHRERCPAPRRGQCGAARPRHPREHGSARARCPAAGARVSWRCSRAGAACRAAFGLAVGAVFPAWAAAGSRSARSAGPYLVGGGSRFPWGAGVHATRCGPGPRRCAAQ